MKKVLIVPNPYLKEKEDTIRSVRKELGSVMSDVFDKVLASEDSYRELEEQISGHDCIITLGGDGSILKIAEKAALSGKPILGINYGGVGYLASLEKDELPLLEKLQDDDFMIEERMMLAAEVDDSFRKLVLNDVMIVKKDINVPIKLQVNDGDIYYGDGIVVATPTGSSAYSYSAGGPLLDSVSRQMVLTPVCPVGRRSSYRIYDDSAVLEIRSIRDIRDEAFFSADGSKPFIISNMSRIRIKPSEYVTRSIVLKKKR
ncbi:MAG: NAD(+)/NADH kinase [Erysipelotrichaceae bacterium]|nr:NAD(+)/NADH kinase [Erysipelotrichaceae bacterium]